MSLEQKVIKDKLEKLQTLYRNSEILTREITRLSNEICDDYIFLWLIDCIENTKEISAPALRKHLDLLEHKSLEIDSLSLWNSTCHLQELLDKNIQNKDKKENL